MPLHMYALLNPLNPVLPHTMPPTPLAPWFVVNFRQASGVLWPVFGAIRVISVILLVASLPAMQVYMLFRRATFPTYRVQRVKLLVHHLRPLNSPTKYLVVYLFISISVNNASCNLHSSIPHLSSVWNWKKTAGSRWTCFGVRVPRTLDYPTVN